MGFFGRFSDGLTRSRATFRERMNIILDRGPKLDEEFWDGLGGNADLGRCGRRVLRARHRRESARSGNYARRCPMPMRFSILLYDEIADAVRRRRRRASSTAIRACVLFVGVNGSGKTTTCGQDCQGSSTTAGRNPWFWVVPTRFAPPPSSSLRFGRTRADVEMVLARTRGRPCQRMLRHHRARRGAEAPTKFSSTPPGRLHTSADLMRELEKVVNVVRKRSKHAGLQCACH